MNVALIEKAAADSLRRKQQFEIQQWKKWKDGGEKPEDLRPLLKSLNPLIQKQVGVYKNRVPIPPAALEAEFKKHALGALRTYDPKRGTQLNTHVSHHLKKGRRYVTSLQNFGYIPEHRAYKIGQFNLAQNTLTERFGRPPNSQELAENLGWNVAEVGRMQRELRADIPASGFEVDPAANMPSREREALILVQAELSPDELSVFEYITGMNGKPVMPPGQVALKLGMSPSKVSRVKKSIEKKLSGFLFG